MDLVLSLIYELYEKAKDESGLEEGYEGLESKEMA